MTAPKTLNLNRQCSLPVQPPAPAAFREEGAKGECETAGAIPGERRSEQCKRNRIGRLRLSSLFPTQRTQYGHVSL